MVPIRGNVRGSRSPVFIKVLDYIEMPQMSQQGVSKVNTPWSARNEHYVAVAIKLKCVCEREQRSAQGNLTEWPHHHLQLFKPALLYFTASCKTAFRQDAAFGFSCVFVHSHWSFHGRLFWQWETPCKVSCGSDSWTCHCTAECQHSPNISSMQYMFLCFCVRSIWPQTDVFPQDTKCL